MSDIRISYRTSRRIDLGRTRIGLGTGEGHRERCLEVLALFDADGALRPASNRAARK